MKQETADAIIEEYRKRHKGIALSWLFERYINSLVVEDEQERECTCHPANFKIGQPGSFPDPLCPRHRHLAKETDEEISLRMWEEFQDYIQEIRDTGYTVSELMAGIKSKEILDFPDWLKVRK